MQPQMELLAPVCVSVEEAGRLLSLGRSVTWELVSSGKLPSYRIGGRRVVRVDDIRKFADQLQPA